MSTSEPSPMDQGMDVVAAGEAAAAAEPEPAKKRAAARRAIKSTSAEKGFELTDEQADKLAGAVVGQLKELLDELPAAVGEFIRKAGGFDHLPEPLAAPPAPTGTGSRPAEPEPPALPAHDTPPGDGRSRGVAAFARWFRGG